MQTRIFLIIFLLFAHPCFAYKVLSTSDRYIYEMYEPHDEIPQSILTEGETMYLEAYLNPKLHEGIPLDALDLDASEFNSYELFIADMFRRDFASYQFPSEYPRTYLQVRKSQDGKIVGICAVLEQTDKDYYVDHVGVHKDFRHQKIATALITQLIKNIPEFKQISLDTRFFNKPAHTLYEKLGFRKLEMHPIASKQTTYFHYIFTKTTL